ncbi:MAG TPA: hypothetical protein VFN82_06335 [Solirubrobacterales bacterium]|nr:hypothetical protein [Solirubrobacterales bacterium]
MALSEDKKAILRLLAQRGAQGYEDLAALMGISVQEVHERAREAAAELEADGIPAPPIPEPGEAARSESRPQPPEPRPEPPQSPEQKPEPRQAAPPRPRAALPRGERKPLPQRLKRLEGRGLWALLAGVAIVVVFVVILLVSGGGGDSGQGSTTSGATSPAGTPQKAKEVTEAILNPVDGSEASGAAIFGRIKNTLALQIAAQGLEPTGKGTSYTVWLAASPQRMLPLATTEVGKDGRINAQVEVPTEVLAYLADETFSQIAVTRTDEGRLQASLRQATKAKKAPAYTGTEILRGTVTGPIVGAANREEAK